MTSDPTLGRRVSRLENDTESLYELVSEIRSTQEEHTRRFDGVETRLDGLETRFDGLETRFDGLETRFDGLETRFDGLETGFDGLATRLGGIQETLVEVVRRLPEP